jgi:hypothetical protein
MEAAHGRPAFPSWLHVYVEDVDATYQRALEAGGVSVQAPELPAATVTHDFAAHNRIALIEDLQQRNPQSQCDHAITPARFRAGVSV